MEAEGSLPYIQEPTTAPYPDHIHPVHIFPTYLSKIHRNIILPSEPRSSKWPLSFRYSEQNILCIYLPRACYTPHSSHPSWLDYPNNIRWSVQVL